MREVGLINLSITSVTPEEKDREIKEKFFDLDYESPFVIGMEVLFTFPSAASNKKWSGELILPYTCDIKLIGVPPTRWLYTEKMKAILKDIAKARL